MITSLVGYVNGEKVIFTRKEGTFWTVDVPFVEDGKYVTELWAENDIGRVSHVCTALLVIAGHELKAFVMNHSYAIGSVNISPEVRKKKFTAFIMEGGYRIERAVCTGCI